MCTGFERSAYQVFKAFRGGTPLTVNAVKSELGEERFFLFLGGGNTLGRFVRGLRFEGFLEGEESEGYSLTQKGTKKMQELEQKACA